MVGSFIDLKPRETKPQRARVQPVAYRAGRSDATVGWRRPATSANSQIDGNIHLLRNGARQIARDYPTGAALVSIGPKYISGAGVRPAVKTDDDDERLSRAEMAWAAFEENCDREGLLDFWAQQQMVARAVIETGEALRLWQAERIDARRFRWTCTVLEGDYLDSSKTASLADGGYIIQGVEFGPDHRRRAYWLYDQHPGDSGRIIRGGWVSRRVPASVVDHIFLPERPGQVRGVSWLAPVMITLRNVEQLGDAELIRRKIQAAIGVVVRHPSPAPEDVRDLLMSPSTDGSAADAAIANLTDSQGNPYEQMVPGAILHAPPGADIDFLASPDSPGLTNYISQQLRLVAAARSIPAHLIDADLARANFSSLRAGRLDFVTALRGWQNVLMIRMSGLPAWQRVMRGEFGPDAAVPVEWRRPVLESVDPLKQSQADAADLENGVVSRRELCEMRGRDWQQVIRDQIEWEMTERRLRTEAGLPAKSAGSTPPPAPPVDDSPDDNPDDNSDDSQDDGTDENEDDDDATD